MNIGKKIAQNSIFQIVGKIIGTALGLVTVGLMLRYLEPERFGYYTTVITYLSFFGILVEFGLHLVTLQMVGEARHNKTYIIQNIFSLRVLSTIVSFTLAPLIIWVFPYPDTVKWGVLVTAISFIAIAISQIMTAVLQIYLHADKVGIAEVCGRIMLLCTVMAVIYADLGFLMVMAAVVTGSVMQCFITYFYARKHVVFALTYDKAVWFDILKRAWPIGLSILFNLLYLKSDIFILTFTQSQQDVGIYGATYRFLDILTTIPPMIMGLLLPLLTKYWIDKNHTAFNSLFQKTFDIFSIVALPVIAGTIATAPALIKFVAGSNYAESIQVLQILVCSIAALYIGGGIYGYSIIALNKQRQMVWGYAITAIIAISGYLYVIPRYSYIGAAYMTVVTEYVIAFILAWYVYRITRYVPSFTVLIKACFASAIMYICVIAGASYGLVAQIGIGVIVYSGIMYGISAIKKEDMVILVNKT
jgi:O-antigen/teichoic acid export membrane protein